MPSVRDSDNLRGSPFFDDEEADDDVQHEPDDIHVITGIMDRRGIKIEAVSSHTCGLKPVRPEKAQKAEAKIEAVSSHTCGLKPVRPETAQKAEAKIEAVSRHTCGLKPVRPEEAQKNKSQD